MDAARNDNGENSRPQSRGPARVLVRRVMLTVGSTLLALLACEGLLRAIGYSYTPLHIVNAYAARNDRRQYHSFEDKHFRSDPLAFWRPREGYPPFNAQGFRGEELPREKGPTSSGSSPWGIPIRWAGRMAPTARDRTGRGSFASCCPPRAGSTR